jgi:hypothetical protein
MLGSDCLFRQKTIQHQQSPIPFNTRAVLFLKTPPGAKNSLMMQLRHIVAK